jgi:bacterioferritin
LTNASPTRIVSRILHATTNIPGLLISHATGTRLTRDAVPAHEIQLTLKEEIVPDTQRPALTDKQEIRRRARQNLENGPVTEAYRADRTKVIELLNEALATEIVCVLRYKRHYFMAVGIHGQSVAQEFLEHANEEQTHADEIAVRITQLGGEPNLNPKGILDRSHSEYVEGKTLVDMIREDLVAERVAIDSYNEMIRYIGADDPTTRRMLEGILATEEEHANDLADLLATLDPTKA